MSDVLSGREAGAKYARLAEADRRAVTEILRETLAGVSAMKRTARWECHHCKATVEAGEEHDCWTTTEAALTQDLSEDLRDAWERMRETAAELRRAADLRLAQVDHVLAQVLLLLRAAEEEASSRCASSSAAPCKAPQVRRVERKSKTKIVHIIHVTHRDEVEAPITDWLQEAYDFNIPTASTKSRGSS